MAMQFKKNLLNLAVCSAVMGLAPTVVLAQDGAVVDEVVVIGMRSSLNTAQELKRNADTVKDVITASDIGSLPDKSVTEALQRVPGVTIERFASSDDPKHYADEGTGVLVRGLDRVRSEVNGRGAFSANPWGGLSYEDFPAELLGAVEVVKNQTADLAAGGIAGTVNLITRKPLDSDERLLAFSAKANYGDFREEVTPSFSALFSDNWETSAGTFGFLLSGSQSEFETRGDGVGLGNFHARGTDTTPNASFDEWGTSVGPGKVLGNWDGPCVPKALAWTPSCNGVAANQITAEDAYFSPFDGPAIQGQQDGTTLYVPAQYHMSTAENDRERTGFTTSLQWENTDETVLATLEHISSNASLEWRERTMGQAAQGFKNFMGKSHDWRDDAENNRPLNFDQNGFLTSGIGIGVEPETPLSYRSRWNYNESTVEDTSFNLLLKPMDRLTVELDYQHIDSEKLVYNYSMSARTNGGTAASEVVPFFLDLRGSRPTMEFLNSAAETPYLVTEDLPSTFLGTGMEQQEFNEAQADSFKIDVAYEFDGALTAIKTGAYYTDKDLTVRDTNYAGFSPIGTPWVPADRMAASPLTRPELFERVDFSDYYGGRVLLGDVNSFLFPKMDLVKNYADSLRRGCAEGWSGLGDSVGNAADGSGGCAKPYADMSGRIDGPFGAQDVSASNEKRTEFYVRGDFAFDDFAVPVKGNIGVRYVGYELESTGYLVLPSTTSRGGESASAVLERDFKPYYDIAEGAATQSTVNGTDYNTVLPSLNLTFGVHDDVVVRFGASKGLFFPSLVDTRNTAVLNMDYTSIRENPNEPLSTDNPVVEIKDISLTAAASNPYLEPEESINFDLSTEWYFANAGSVSLGLFHKKLDNIIRNTAFDFGIERDGFQYPISAYGPANTGSGTIRGAELSYSQFYDMLPGAWSGLGLQFNYTYIDQNGLEDPNSATAPNLRFKAGGIQEVDKPSEGDRNDFRVFSGLPLQGYSDQNMNVVGMYEYNDISFRLAYTWRSEYLLTLRESEDFVPVFTKASGMVDASLYYTINDSWKVGVEGNNLLNAETKTQYQLNQEGDRTDALSFTTDRRYAVSVRATF